MARRRVTAGLRRVGGIAVGLMGCSAVTVLAQAPLPVVDVHLHAMAAAAQGPPPLGICIPFGPFPVASPPKPFGATFLEFLKEPPCENPVWSPVSDEELMTKTLETLEEHNVYGVLSGSVARVGAWDDAAPGRFLRGLGFTTRSGISPDSLRALHAAGLVNVLAEVTNQYLGIAPNDPSMEPYWALAEELDIPVGIHIGPGPPGAAYLGSPEYRGRLHSPLALEDVLVRHPRLRVYVMHAGFPMRDDLLALLYAHPQVHVGTGVIVYGQPRAAFYSYLQAIVDAGFEDRVLFGSDQMVWPETVPAGIAAIREAPFLSDQQKRKILYNNAARFFRFDASTMERHQQGR